MGTEGLLNGESGQDKLASEKTDQAAELAELRERDEQYGELFENANDLMYTTDLAGRFTMVNRMGEAVTGFSRDELIGMDQTQLIAPHHLERAIAMTRKKMSGDRDSTVYELDIIDKGGNRVPLELSTRLIMRDGAPAGIQGIARDIRERKAAEAAVRASEVRAATIVATAMDAVITMDTAGEIISWNGQAETMFGISAVAAIGARVADLIVPERYREAHSTGLARYLGTGVGPAFGRRLELMALRSTGEEFPVELTLSPVTTANEVTFCAFVRDISERKQSEAELRAAHDLNEMIVDRVTNAIATIDLAGRLQFVNRRACEITGYSVEELTGASVSLLLAEDQLAYVQAAFGRVAQEMTTVSGIEVVITRKDGQTRVLRFGLAPIVEGGQLKAFVGAAEDVTDWHEVADNLARHKAVVESSESAIVSSDLNHIIRTWNKAAERLYGWTAEEAIGQHILLSQPPGPTEFAHVLLSRLLGGEVVQHFELRRQTRDGSIIDVDMTAFPVYNEVGKTVGTASITRDISQQKLTDEALRQTQKLESLGVLAGGIAHDFNNLLVGVLANAGFLREAMAPGDEALEYVQQMETAARRATELARQMLAYTGRGPVRLEEVDLNNLVDEMTHLLRSSIGKGVTVARASNEKMAHVSGDATQLRQVIMNLVINASDAIGDETGTIAIRTSVVDMDRAAITASGLSQDLRPGPYVMLEVADSGCGMDQNTLGRVFDPFFTTKFTGRGLGLAAVLGIVRGHKGAIRVNSEPGKGSEFRLYLPLSVTAAVEPPALHVVVPWSPDGTILVVDDEETVRIVASRALKMFGFDVLLARDGLEALDMVREHGDRLRGVLLDLTMPRMNGTQAFSELRKVRPNLPVLIMSGYSEEEALSTFGKHTPEGFLQKPFDLQSLRGEVRSLLERQVAPKRVHQA